MSIHAHTRSAAAIVAAVFVLTSLTGCAKARPTLGPIDADLYASGKVYTYQPLNPTTIWVRDAMACELDADETQADITSTEFKDALLRDLDTETLRISLAKLSGDASVTAAIVGASVKGESYVLIVDYIKYFTSRQFVKIDYEVPNGTATSARKSFEGHVPVYAGVGVRIRAEFTALQSGVNISGLPALAIAANANSINGRLTVQTMGITGPQITGLMPILSDISVSSIQSAVQAVAAIKAKLYEDSTVAYPKFVGFESPSTNVDAIMKMTEVMYGLEQSVVPRVSPNPMKAGQKLLSIGWFPPSDQCPQLAETR